MRGGYFRFVVTSCPCFAKQNFFLSCTRHDASTKPQASPAERGGVPGRQASSPGFSRAWHFRSRAYPESKLHKNMIFKACKITAIATKPLNLQFVTAWA